MGFGQPLTLTATVSPASATGSVSFYDTATLIGTANLNAGIATLQVSNLSLGAHSLLAGYGGDANYGGSFSSFLSENVAAASTVTVTSSANPANFGQRVTLTATVSPSTAGGVVTFYDGQTILGVRALSGGHATLTTGLVQQGARSVWAHYGGDASDAASNSAVLAQTVGAIPAQANGFLPPTSTTSTFYSYAYVAADFNGDGKADWATATSTGNGYAVAVYLGKGDGTFQSAVNYSVPVSVSAMVVGDFNGDGLPDLAVAGSGGVSVLLGNVDGTFKQPVTTSSGSAWTSIATADFNGDGNNDILVADNSGNLTVLLGRGDGTFQPGASRTVGTFAPVIGDFNGDGVADVVVPYYSGLSLLLGNGDGTFQPAKSLPNVSVWGNVVVADFNGDGKADLAVIDVIGVTVLAGNGDGTFTAPVHYSTSFTPNYIALADLNGDGNLDLVLGTYGLVTLLGNGDGTFQSAVSYPLSGYGSGPIVVADFNGDGRQDILFGSNIMLGAMATQFKFTAQPVNAVAGGTLPPVAVQAQDPSGNTVWTGSTVNLTSTPAGVNATATAANGLATFSNLVINTAGSYTFTAASTGLTSATSNVFTISPSTASKLGFSMQPSNAAVGAAISPAVVVQVQDQYGNLITGSTASVTVASIPSGVTATLNAQGGIATFSSLSFGSAGNYTLVASTSGLSSAISNTFTIGGSAGSKLVFSTQPASAVAGATMPPVVVQVQDSGGNVVTSSNASITLISTAAGINATAAAVNGVATFNNLVVNAAGSYTLTATSGGITSATSSSFTISPASASKLVFTTQPANGSVGTAIAPVVVKVQDAYGNLVTTSVAAITVASTPSGVSATVNAVNGVATFSSLVFSAGGSYTLTATSTGLSSAASGTFNIASPTFSISGSITLNGNALSGVVVTLSGGRSASTVTSGSGGYSIGGLAGGGNYTVTPTLTGYSFNPANQTLTNLAANQTASFAASVGSSAVTWYYLIESPPRSLPGVSGSDDGVIVLVNSLSGSVSACATYTLLADNTTHTMCQPSSSQASPYQVVRLDFGTSASNFRVTAISVTVGSVTKTVVAPAPTVVYSQTTSYVVVSGQVTVSGAGLGGVTINVNGSLTNATTTDANGSYGIALPTNGTYMLSASRVGYSFNGPVTLSNLSANQAANFTGINVPALEFFPVTPCRLVDTRVSSFQAGFGPPTMAAGETRTFAIPSNNACGIPSAAAAYSLNITVVTKGYLGILSVWPAGQTMPNVSTLNSYSNVSTAVANAAIVPAGANGAISVYVTDATELIIDINGYFLASTSGMEFFPVTPCRLVDTRVSSFQTGFGPPSMSAGGTRSFTIPSNNSCGIPANAAAYSLNVTAVPQKTLGFLSIWPVGKPLPNVSTLNVYNSGTVVANAAIVPAGTNGAINAYVTDQTDLVIDINGYFAPGTNGLKLYPMAPCRVADTRVASFPAGLGGPSMGAGTSRSFTVPQSTCGVPVGAGAYSFNFTAVPQAPQLGIFTTWPTGLSMPNVSTMNSYNGSVVANAAIVPAGSNGAISIYVTDSADVLFDVNGYFAQ